MNIDRILTRKLYLQRYVTRVYNDLRELNTPLDKKLISMLAEFVSDADTKTLIALSQQRTSNKAAADLLRGIKQIIKEQELLTLGYFADELPKLIEHQAVATAAAIGATSPALRGVATLPINGSLVSSRVANAYSKVLARTVSEVTQLAATDPQSIVKVIKGTKDNNNKDGLLFWRNDRLLKPETDLIVNGASTNADMAVYDSFKIDKVDWLATLDYRVCIQCAAAEANGPYLIAEAPRPAIHPYDRCVLIPHIEGMKNERPFVKDIRSVSKIPKDERAGKIGTTRKGMESFIRSMPDADLKDLLGPTRFELYKSGKVKSVKDLVNEATLEPLTIEELPQ